MIHFISALNSQNTLHTLFLPPPLQWIDCICPAWQSTELRCLDVSSFRLAMSKVTSQSHFQYWLQSFTSCSAKIPLAIWI